MSLSAATCSDSCIEPISTVNAVPSRPAKSTAVMSTPSSRMTTSTVTDPTHSFPPKMLE